MRVFLLLTLVGVLAAACGSNQAQPTAANGDQGASVTIANFAYDPATLSVSVNQQITWTNEDSAAHTVTFEGGPDSGSLETGATFQHAFTSAGEFSYRCTFHPAMQGVVNVGP